MIFLKILNLLLKKIDLDIELPDLKAAEVDSDGMGFFGFIFKVLVPLSILGVGGYVAFTYFKQKNEMINSIQKKSD